MKKRKVNNPLKLAMVAALAVIIAFTCKVSVDAATSAITDANGNQKSQITAHEVTTGTETDANKYDQYLMILSSAEESGVFPLKLTKSGYYEYAISVGNGYGTSGYIQTEIYSDKACTKKLSGVHATIDLTKETSVFGYASIPKAGTYYLKLTVGSAAAEGTEAVAVGIASHLFNANDRTLTDKKLSAAYTNQNKNIYYKVNVKKTGYITVKQDYLALNKAGKFVPTESTGYSYITLCNSKKKALTASCYNSLSVTNHEQVFAVQKGTYYLKVKSSNIYRIKSTFKAATDQSGSKQSSAKSISLGGKATGLIQSTDKTSKADWYKFKLSKNRGVKITVTGNACNGTGDFKIQLVPPKGVTLIGNSFTARGTRFQEVIQSKGSLHAGTWYVKITKTNSKLTGNYTISVK